MQYVLSGAKTGKWLSETQLSKKFAPSLIRLNQISQIGYKNTKLFLQVRLTGAQKYIKQSPINGQTPHVADLNVQTSSLFAAHFSLQHGAASFKAGIFCESDSRLMFLFSSYDPPNDATSKFKKQDNMFLQYRLAQL